MKSRGTHGVVYKLADFLFLLRILNHKQYVRFKVMNTSRLFHGSWNESGP